MFVFRAIAPRASHVYPLHHPVNFWFLSNTPVGSQGTFSEPFAQFCKTFFRLDSSSSYQETFLNVKNEIITKNTSNWDLSKTTTKMKNTSKGACGGCPQYISQGWCPILTPFYYTFLSISRYRIKWIYLTTKTK